MAVNKQAFKLAEVDYQTYVKWCKEHKKPINSHATMSDFFNRVREGRLCIDYYGNLVVKKKRRQ